MSGGRPRILVVAADRIGSANNTGITLANLLADWPDADLAQIYTVPTSWAGARPAVPGLLVTQDRLPPLRAYRWLSARRGSRPAPASRDPAAPSPSLSPGSRPEWQRAWADVVPFSSLPDVDDLVRRFRPDLVLTPTGSIRIARLALRAADRAGVPTVPMFMDDWLATLYRRPASRVPRQLLLRAVRRVVRRAHVGLAISPVMASEYSATWGVPFHFFGNAVDEADFGVPTAADAGSECHLLYVGGLHLGRAETLLAVAQAVETLPGVRLTVVAPEPPRSFVEAVAGLASTRLADAVAPSAVMSLLASGDVLVHVESFEPAYVAYTRLSLSTKIPQYLAAARPVLGVGPAELASMAYLADAGAGGVVHRPDADRIRAALVPLLDPQVRREAGARGLLWAERSHAAGSRSRELARLLAEAVRPAPARPSGAERSDSPPPHTG